MMNNIAFEDEDKDRFQYTPIESIDEHDSDYCQIEQGHQALLTIKTQTKQKLIDKINYIIARKQAKDFINNKSGTINRQKLALLKAAFDQYTKGIDLPAKQKTTLSSIGQNLNLSMCETQALYVQYTNDPNFIQRLSILDAQLRLVTPNKQKCDQQMLIEQRVQFLQELIKRKGPLTENQIMAEMNKVDHLHQFNKGIKMPISRKIVQHIMKLSNVLPRMIPSLQRPPSSGQTIKNRYIYSRRYLQLTDDKIAEICFIGQFSFCNNFTLSSCPLMKRDTFVNYQCGRGSRRIKITPKEEDVSDRWGRNLQILVAITVHGIIHYELHSNIFSECNFLKTVLTIARQMRLCRPHHNKYLIVETSFFHCKQALRKMEKFTQVKTIFLPPQTPMLNPTEYFFNEFKQIVKSKANKQHRTYGAIATQLLASMRETNMQNYYLCIKPYLQLALRQQSFK